MTSIPTASSTFSSGTAPPLSPADGVTEAELKKKLAEWNKSIGEAASRLNSPVNDEKERNKAQQHYQELYHRRSEFMKEDRTGFVWLYLRK